MLGFTERGLQDTVQGNGESRACLRQWRVPFAELLRQLYKSGPSV
jgi:hypothetical protein